jgi:mono/diheme cytochrome c family protein
VINTQLLKTAAILGFVVTAAVFVTGSFSPKVSGAVETVEGSGAELFAASCARCHGADGTGGKGPNLASEKRQAKWRDSDAKLVKKITNGGMFMPSFGKKLKPDEIKAIADHVRTLKE